MKRRECLRVGGTAVALGMVSLSGCLGNDDEDGAGGNDDTIAGEEWLVVPGALADDLEHYDVRSTAPATVEEYAADLNQAAWDSYQSQWLNWETAQPDPGDVQRLILASGSIARPPDDRESVSFVVAEHELDEEALLGNLEAAGFDDAGEYEGFSLLEREEGLDMRALGDGVFVSGRRSPTEETDDDARRILEAVIDSSLGNADRYVDESDEVSAVLDTLDTHHNFRFDDYPGITQTQGRQGVFEGSIARGSSSRFEDGQVVGTHAEEFVEGTDVIESAIEDYLDVAALFANAEGLDWGVAGSQVVIDWTVDFEVANQVQLG